jgi:HIRAN domain
VQATLFEGDTPLEVVGESYYQDALWTIVGGRCRDPVRYDTYAVLDAEADNPHDANAIRVLIDGLHVGHLSRSDAAAYRAGLVRLASETPTGKVAVRARIIGGGERGDGIGFLGVSLRHEPRDFGIDQRGSEKSRSRVRTGLSDAMATDAEDDKYDLSWYADLSSNDVTAIKQLRKSLESEQDLIDRHFMLCELEKRLYRSRDAFASALDEFDDICRIHEGEMISIRPALLEKFGAIPLIDMYRQAAVRCQKAKNWEAMHEWASRGIAIYGDLAARPEAVEDLRKRLAYAKSKLRTVKQAKLRNPGTASVSQAAEVETLVCESCGSSFERIRSRGRKPRMCPECSAF